MYVETVEGEMNEAFVQCPIIQDIDRESQKNTVSGNCTIIVSMEDAVFAELTCEGERGLCRGKVELTGGKGRFNGVSGSSKMVVRSPVPALTAAQSDGTVLHVAAGIIQSPKLIVKLP